LIVAAINSNVFHQLISSTNINDLLGRQ